MSSRGGEQGVDWEGEGVDFSFLDCTSPFHSDLRVTAAQPKLPSFCFAICFGGMEPYNEGACCCAELRNCFLFQKDVYRRVIVPARDRYFPALERFLAKSGSRYLVDKTVTWAEFVESKSLATWEELVPGFLEETRNWRNMQGLFDNSRTLPNGSTKDLRRHSKQSACDVLALTIGAQI